jgi:crotonobetainyl-CoA:carnitine CoA-transferase CaiB-like acyl-CoA transferase
MMIVMDSVKESGTARAGAPLEGVRVLDVTAMLLGPLATLVLGRLSWNLDIDYN